MRKSSGLPWRRGRQGLGAVAAALLLGTGCGGGGGGEASFDTRISVDGLDATGDAAGEAPFRGAFVDVVPDGCGGFRCAVTGTGGAPLTEGFSVAWRLDGADVADAGPAFDGAAHPGALVACVATLDGGEAVASEEVAVELPSLAIDRVALGPKDPIVGDEPLTCAPFGVRTGACAKPVALQFGWLVDGAPAADRDGPTFDTTGLAAGTRGACVATAQLDGRDGPAATSEERILRVLQEGAPRVRVAAADDHLTCEVVDAAGIDLATAGAWTWEINDRPPFAGAQQLPRDRFKDCDLVRCWVTVPRAGGDLVSNRPELALPLGADCGAGSACTAPACDPAGGCATSARNGAECDGGRCVVDGLCRDGECVGRSLRCADGDPCTADRCDPVQGCTSSPATGEDCDDGDPSTDGDRCREGLCVGNSSGACSTDDDCTAADTCLRPRCRSGRCVTEALDGACDDGDPCTTDDRCVAGRCTGDGSATTAYRDGDGDGHGGDEVAGCADEAGLVAAGGDCDDGDAAVHPDAVEQGDDGVDSDCDGRELFAGSLLTLRDPIGSATYEAGVQGTFDLGPLGRLPVEGRTWRSANGPVQWCLTTSATPTLGPLTLESATVEICRGADGRVVPTIAGSGKLAGFDIDVAGTLSLDGGDFDLTATGRITVEGHQGDLVSGTQSSFVRRVDGEVRWQLQALVGTLPLAPGVDLTEASLTVDADGVSLRATVELGSGPGSLRATATGAFVPDGAVTLTLGLDPGRTWRPFGDQLDLAMTTVVGTLERSAAGELSASVTASAAGEVRVLPELRLREAWVEGAIGGDGSWGVTLGGVWGLQLGPDARPDVTLEGTIANDSVSFTGQVTGLRYEPLAPVIGPDRFAIVGTSDDPLALRVAVGLTDRSLEVGFDAPFELCVVGECPEPAGGLVSATGQLASDGFAGLFLASLDRLELPLLGPLPDLVLVASTEGEPEVEFFDGAEPRDVPRGLTLAVRSELPVQLPELEAALIYISVGPGVVSVEADLGLEVPVILPEHGFPSLDRVTLEELSFYAELVAPTQACPAPEPEPEVEVPPECDDGVDNDGDGRVDRQDPGCADKHGLTERPACDDGVDNDGDGTTDLKDPGCKAAADDSEGEAEPVEIPEVEIEEPDPDEADCKRGGSRMGLRAAVTLQPDNRDEPLLGEIDLALSPAAEASGTASLRGLWVEPLHLRDLAVQNPAITLTLNFSAAGLPVPVAMGFNLDLFWKKQGEWPAALPPAAPAPDNVLFVGTSAYFDKTPSPSGLCALGRCATLPPLLFRFELANLSLDDLVAFVNDATRAAAGPLAEVLPAAELEPVELDLIDVHIQRLKLQLSTHTLDFFGQPIRAGVHAELRATVDGRGTDFVGSMDEDGLFLHGTQDGILLDGLSIVGRPLRQSFDVREGRVLWPPGHADMRPATGALELWVEGDFCAYARSDVASSGDLRFFIVGADCDADDLAPLRLEAGGRVLETRPRVASGRPVHLAVAWSPTDATFFVDGEVAPLARDSRPGGAIAPTSRWFVGSRNADPGVDLIDDVRFWRGPLTAAQVGLFARRLPTRYLNPGNIWPASPLIARFDFDFDELGASTVYNTRYFEDGRLRTSDALDGGETVTTPPPNKLEFSLSLPNPLADDAPAPGFGVRAGAAIRFPAASIDFTAAIDGEFSADDQRIAFFASPFALLQIGEPGTDGEVGALVVSGNGPNQIDDHGFFDDGIYGEFDFAQAFYSATARLQFQHTVRGITRRELIGEGAFLYSGATADGAPERLAFSVQGRLALPFEADVVALSGQLQYGDPAAADQPPHAVTFEGALELFGQEFSGIGGEISTDAVEFRAAWRVPAIEGLEEIHDQLPSLETRYRVDFAAGRFCGEAHTSVGGEDCTLTACFEAGGRVVVEGCDILDCGEIGCPPGFPCTRDGDCEGMCVNGFCGECARDGDCASGQYCLLAAVTGNLCRDKAREGGSCGSDPACQAALVCREGQCRAGCDRDFDCASRNYCRFSAAGACWCHEGACKRKLARGEACVEDRVCRDPYRCVALQCNVPGGLGVPCDSHGDCSGDLLCDITCVECLTDGDCSSDEYCEGNAVGANTCEPKKRLEQTCADDDECRSGHCDVICVECTTDAHCPSGEYCEGNALLANTCERKKPLLRTCASHAECASGYCDVICVACLTDAHCPADRYCEGNALAANTCDRKKRRGQGCLAPAECASGHCDVQCVDCLADSHCGAGEFCHRPALAVNTCEPKRALGGDCAADGDCQSGHCDLHCVACLNDGHCASNQWCDTPIGQLNSCRGDLSNGTWCSRDAQCRSGTCLFCANPAAADGGGGVKCRSRTDCL